MKEYKFKAKARWFGIAYYALVFFIIMMVILLGQPIEVILICLMISLFPMVLIPFFLNSEYVIRNGKILFTEDSTYYDLQGNREKDHKSLFLDIGEIWKIEVIKNWWSNDHVRIWINEYKIDSQVISVTEIDKFISIIKNENNTIQIE